MMQNINQTHIKSTLGIRGRLLMGFFIIAVILLCFVGATLTLTTSSEKTAKQTILSDLPQYDRLLDLGEHIYLTQSALRGLFINNDTQIQSDFNRAWNNIDRILQSIDTTKDTNKWQELKANVYKLKEKQLQLKQRVGTDIKDSSTILLFNETTAIENQILTILDGPITASGERIGGLYDVLDNELTTGTNKILNDLNSIRLVEIFLMVIIVVLSMVISLTTAKLILTPINKAINIARAIAEGKRDEHIIIKSNDETGQLLSSLKVMQEAIKTNEEKLHESEEKTRDLLNNILRTAKSYSNHSSRVAKGDLTQYLEVEKNDVMTQLGDDLNQMTNSLSSISKQITDACHNMVVTMDEVKRSIDVQSSGASEQASSINEITASIEEIEKSTMQTMEKAKYLGDSAERTREKGQQGLTAIEQSIEGMQVVREKVQIIAQTILGLSEQTQQVGEITTVVNTLAQQLKMLALNASIEAAKAGESGKGFAVVAAEVKNLAEQSEQSTVQVQKILESIRHAAEKAVIVTEEGTKGVDHGTSLVEQTGDIVRDLSTVIHETSIASQQIEASIRQESVGIEQITAGMSEINQVTSSFVESTKQTTDAITNLADVAKKLKENIDFYKI